MKKLTALFLIILAFTAVFPLTAYAEEIPVENTSGELTAEEPLSEGRAIGVSVAFYTNEGGFVKGMWEANGVPDEFTATEDSGGAVLLPEGTEVTLLCRSESEEYYLESLKINGADVEYGGGYTFTASADTTVEAVWGRRETASINANISGDGRVSMDGHTIISGEPSFSVPIGENVTIDFEPAEGYLISKAAVNGEPVNLTADENGYSLTLNSLKDGDTLEVLFAKAVSVSFYTNEGGSVKATWEVNDTSDEFTATVSSGGNIIAPEGTQIAILCKADTEDYYLSSLRINGADAEYTDNYTITANASETVVEAEWAKSVSAAALTDAEDSSDKAKAAKKSPKTGDEENVLFYIALIAAAGLASAAALIYRRKA